MASKALFDTCRSDSPSLYGSLLSFEQDTFEADEPATNDFQWVDGNTVSAEEVLWGESEEDRDSRVYGSDELDPPFHEEDYWEFDTDEDRLPMSCTLNGEAIRRDDERFSELALRFEAADRAYHDEAEFEELHNGDEQALPSFSSNHEGPRRLTWTEAEDKWFRAHIWSGRHNGGRKLAKHRINGKRARKCSRDLRFGNRQEFAELRDYWADLYEEMLGVPEFVDYPRIPEFEPPFVGLTDEEASYYEAEMRREEAAFEAELESSLWGYHEDRGHSAHFKPLSILDVLIEIHERHLFPENFEEPEPYRFSMFDYDDSYFNGMDYTEHESYYGQFYGESDPWRDEEEWDFFSQEDDDIAEAYEELDRINEERAAYEAADKFMPRFSSSNRLRIRERAREARRGKKARRLPAGRVVQQRYLAALQ